MASLYIPDSDVLSTTSTTPTYSTLGSSSASQIAIGIITGLVSTSVQSLGLTLQRKSHLLEDGKPAHLAKRPPFRRRRWQIGMTLFVLANLVGSSVQITMLPLVILCSLQASGLVFNSICATVILSEPFTNYSLAGTVLVCIGAGLIAVYGAMKDPAHSIDELLELFVKTRFLVWMVFQAVLILGILLAARLSVYLRPRQKFTARMKAFRGIIYGCVSGILSAHCLLLAKCGVELLIRTLINHQNQFNRYESWLIVISLVTLALTQLYYLHRGLRLVSTSLLYPLCFCLYNITAICDGIVYYNYFLPALHIALIAVGTVILLAGVLLLSWRLNDENSQPSTPRIPFPPPLITKGKSTTSTTTYPTEESALLSPSSSQSEDITSEEERLADEESLFPARRRSTAPRRPAYNTIPLPKRNSTAQALLPDDDIDSVDEIWDELEEDSRPLLERGMTSPRIYRRVVSSESGSGVGAYRYGGVGERLERSVTDVGDGVITGTIESSAPGGGNEQRVKAKRSKSVGTVKFLDDVEVEGDDGR